MAVHVIGTMTEAIPAHGPSPLDEAAEASVLLERIAAGDRAAFHAFYELHGARMMALVRRKVRDARLAEEVVQDIFVAAWLSAPGYRPTRGRPERWLLGIARYKVLDHWRRMRRIAAAVGIRADPAGREAGMADSDLRLSLEQALAGLSREQRRLVDLIYQGGLTFAEAAHALKIPAGTVKSRVNAALTTMRAYFAGAIRS